MEIECIICKSKQNNPVGFQTKNGFVCMNHENEKIDTFTVSYSGMGDIVFNHKFDADSFIIEDMEENESSFDDYKITTGSINVLDFNNLEDWDG